MKKLFITLGSIALVIFSLNDFLPRVFSQTYRHKDEALPTSTSSEVAAPTPPVFHVTHIAPPEQTHAVYFTGWAAGTPSFQKHMFSVLDTTSVNAVVIDIKDATGKMSYTPDDPTLQSIGAGEPRIRNPKELIGELHKKGVYVIGRVAVFQDPYLAKKFPEYAVKQSSNHEKIWADRKGIMWVDAGDERVWDYVIAIAHDAYAQGFDEVNFDYVRFPTDGNMTNLYFPKSEGKVKRDVIKSFFTYIHDNLVGKDVKVSADLFGMTTTSSDDMGIGQWFADVLPLVDFVDPMVYPSHYGSGVFGFTNPAEHPGEVITQALAEAINRATAIGQPKEKIRPWLQDFDLGALYTTQMVRAQIDATEKLGLPSWFMWDPKNVYKTGALGTKSSLPIEQTKESNSTSN